MRGSLLPRPRARLPPRPAATACYRSCHLHQPPLSSFLDACVCACVCPHLLGYSFYCSLFCSGLVLDCCRSCSSSWFCSKHLGFDAAVWLEFKWSLLFYHRTSDLNVLNVIAMSCAHLDPSARVRPPARTRPPVVIRPHDPSARFERPPKLELTQLVFPPARIIRSDSSVRTPDPPIRFPAQLARASARLPCLSASPLLTSSRLSYPAFLTIKNSLL